MPRAVTTPFNYAYPNGTLAVSGQPISSIAYNAWVIDLQTTLNSAWPVNYGGTGTTDGSVRASDGSAAAPSLSFSSETTTGFYRVGAGQIGVSILGTNVGTYTATGWSTTQPITITGSTVGFTPFTGISTEAAAAAGPIFDLYRNSASPAVNDVLGRIQFNGRNTTPAKVEYASIETSVVDATAGTEDGSLDIYNVVNGSRTLVASFLNGLTLLRSQKITVATPFIVFNKTTGNDSYLEMQTGGSRRWVYDFSNSTAESGSNAGADFSIQSYSDVAGFLGTPLTIIRATGLTTLTSLSRGAPVTKTANFTVADTEDWIINNKSGSTCTVTMPAAASYLGREIMLKNIQAQTVISAGSNVVPIGGGAAGTAILSANAGRWCTLVSNGTNWEIMAGVI